MNHPSKIVTKYGYNDSATSPKTMVQQYITPPRGSSVYYTVVVPLTCNAADLWETHHDLREAFGLVRVLVFSVVLTHIPVALVQLLELGDIGQSSDIWRDANEKKLERRVVAA